MVAAKLCLVVGGRVWSRQNYAWSWVIVDGRGWSHDLVLPNQKNISSFSFQPVSIDKVKDIIKTLNIKKACPDGDIPVKFIKMNEGILSRLIFQNFKQSLVNGEFLHCLKQAEVIPVLKKRKNLTNPITDL